MQLMVELGMWKEDRAPSYRRVPKRPRQTIGLRKSLPKKIQSPQVQNMVRIVYEQVPLGLVTVGL